MSHLSQTLHGTYTWHDSVYFLFFVYCVICFALQTHRHHSIGTVFLRHFFALCFICYIYIWRALNGNFITNDPYFIFFCSIERVQRYKINMSDFLSFLFISHTHAHEQFDTNTRCILSGKCVMSFVLPSIKTMLQYYFDWCTTFWKDTLWIIMTNSRSACSLVQNPHNRFLSQQHIYKCANDISARFVQCDRFIYGSYLNLYVWEVCKQTKRTKRW